MTLLYVCCAKTQIRSVALLLGRMGSQLALNKDFSVDIRVMNRRRSRYVA